MRKLIASLVFVVGFSSAAVADETLAAGSLFTGPPRDRIVCQFFNAGGTPVQIINPRIFDQFGTPFPLVINQCDDSPSLAQFDTCGIAVDNSESRSWSCKARISPNKTFVRGVLDIRTADGQVKVWIPLQ